MDRVGAGLLGDGDQLLDRQVALGRGRRPDRIGLVGHQDVERLAVGLREHGDGDDPASRQARITRTAISPRFATSSLPIRRGVKARSPRRSLHSFEGLAEKSLVQMSLSLIGALTSPCVNHHAVWRPMSPGISRPSRSW